MTLVDRSVCEWPCVVTTFTSAPPADLGVDPPVVLEPGCVMKVGNQVWTLESMFYLDDRLQLKWRIRIADDHG